MSQICNHCSVILYYVGLELKRCFRLGFHSDYVFSTQNGTFVSSSNSQVKNTTAEIFLLGDSCVLNQRKRILSKIKRSRNYWTDDGTFNESYKIDRDTVAILNPLDEDPLSSKNINESCQYIHSGAHVTGEILSAEIVLRVVSSIEHYNTNDDTMIVDEFPDHNNILHGVLGVDLFDFHNHFYVLSQSTNL